MKKHLLALGLLLAGVSPAQALDVGDISSFMNSGSSTLSKTIKNSTDSGRLINIHLERLFPAGRRAGYPDGQTG
ncbi:hypothetical protein KPZU40_00390 [Klebsiella pneumoniae]|nr:hypothetical protein KPZU40_00390 [Klebsiella pneumoniae]